jgi:Ca2+-transporting ATPase
MGAIIISIFLQICAVYLIFFNVLLNTAPLSLLDWGLIILISSSVFIGDEVRKFITKQVLKYKG